jgi:hypothetical protein
MSRKKQPRVGEERLPYGSASLIQKAPEQKQAQFEKAQQSLKAARKAGRDVTEHLVARAQAYKEIDPTYEAPSQYAAIQQKTNSALDEAKDKVVQVVKDCFSSLGTVLADSNAEVMLGSSNKAEVQTIAAQARPGASDSRSPKEAYLAIASKSGPTSGKGRQPAPNKAKKQKAAEEDDAAGETAAHSAHDEATNSEPPKKSSSADNKKTNQTE